MRRFDDDPDLGELLDDERRACLLGLLQGLCGEDPQPAGRGQCRGGTGGFQPGDHRLAELPCGTGPAGSAEVPGSMHFGPSFFGLLT